MAIFIRISYPPSHRNSSAADRKDKRPIRRNRSEIAPGCRSQSLNWDAARRTERCGSRAPPPAFRGTLTRPLCLGRFLHGNVERLDPQAQATRGLSVRPDSRACVGRGAVASAWAQEARQFWWRRRAGERSEGGRRGLGPPREMVEDFLDHRRIFDAPDHLDRATTVLAGLDIDLDQIAWSDLEQPQAGPEGAGQDARSNTTSVVPARYGVFRR